MDSAGKAPGQSDQPSEQPADPKKQKRFWKRHLKAYMQAVKKHKKELGIKHEIASAEEIEAHPKRRWYWSLAKRLFVGTCYSSLKMSYTEQTLGFRQMTDNR